MDAKNPGTLTGQLFAAAVEAFRPLLGLEVQYRGPAELPWPVPPEALAVLPFTGTTAPGLRGVVWVGGSIANLGRVCSLLTGELPDPDGGLFQDCARELANILGGRVQAWLEEAGSGIALGLPIFVGKAGRFQPEVSGLTGAGARVGLDVAPGAAIELEIGMAIGGSE